MSAEDALARAEELLTRLEKARAELERLSEADDADKALDVLTELAELSKAIEEELQRAKQEAALPAAAALELVHAFSLVHDDLPALDNDAERRGRPSVWGQYGEAVAILAGDALLAEAFRLALSYPTAQVGRELSQATLGMIGGKYLDITGTAPDEGTRSEEHTSELQSR